tara:strand:+ start:1339 stop:2061 length:723 start_codon:yes stop_codon:yes gene_type:complete
MFIYKFIRGGVTPPLFFIRCMKNILQFLLILIFTSCFNNRSKVADSANTEKHWKQNSELVSVSAIVDSVYSLGYDSSFILLPDSKLLVESYLSPTILIFDSNSKAVGVSVCNGHFPNFKEKLLDKIYSFKFNEDLDASYQTKIKHMTTLKGDKFKTRDGAKFTIILGYIQTKGGYVERKFLNVIKELVPTNEIDLKLLVASNYQELKFSDFSFQKRRIQFIMREEGAEIPQSILDEFGIK